MQQSEAKFKANVFLNVLITLIILHINLLYNCFKDLTDVLKYITGGRKMRDGISIDFQEGEGMMASTCGLRLTLPIHATGYPTFKATLNAVISCPAKSSFTMI